MENEAAGMKRLRMPALLANAEGKIIYKNAAAVRFPLLNRKRTLSGIIRSRGRGASRAAAEKENPRAVTLMAKGSFCQGFLSSDGEKSSLYIPAALQKNLHLSEEELFSFGIPAFFFAQRDRYERGACDGPGEIFASAGAFFFSRFPDGELSFPFFLSFLKRSANLLFGDDRFFSPASHKHKEKIFADRDQAMAAAGRAVYAIFSGKEDGGLLKVREDGVAEIRVGKEIFCAGTLLSEKEARVVEPYVYTKDGISLVLAACCALEFTLFAPSRGKKRNS